METAINTATPTAPAADTQQSQAYEYLAQFIKKDLTDYWTERDTAKVLLHERIEGLGWALGKLSSIGHSDFHYLNRAVSFYLKESTDKHIKDNVIGAMNKAIETALILSLHSDDMGYWCCLLNKITDNLNEINGAEADAKPDPIQERSAKDVKYFQDLCVDLSKSQTQSEEQLNQYIEKYTKLQADYNDLLTKTIPDNEAK